MVERIDLVYALNFDNTQVCYETIVESAISYQLARVWCRETVDYSHELIIQEIYLTLL